MSVSNWIDLALVVLNIALVIVAIKQARNAAKSSREANESRQQLVELQEEYLRREEQERQRARLRVDAEGGQNFDSTRIILRNEGPGEAYNIEVQFKTDLSRLLNDPPEQPLPRLKAREALTMPVHVPRRRAGHAVNPIKVSWRHEDGTYDSLETNV